MRSKHTNEQYLKGKAVHVGTCPRYSVNEDEQYTVKGRLIINPHVREGHEQREGLAQLREYEKDAFRHDRCRMDANGGW